MIAATVESFALKGLLPLVPHVVVSKFNWFDEKARVFAENVSNIVILEI